ncbi:hypothetical protein SCLCIDRAFT_498123 [Scleroderma citrinum Foug A]|uniref:Secreted protein n=1 Tax=Scleroderma citrinum Foug A TaxID=1036808 RepID=A0A0C3AYF4_9AGAM|nr:hypothetical protein SCLCIDRAFT_498123 [Scleroderma citrinum Foug A]
MCVCCLCFFPPSLHPSSWCLCAFVGILGLDDGVQFMPSDKKHYWRHDVYIPMPSGDFPADKAAGGCVLRLHGTVCYLHICQSTPQYFSIFSFHPMQHLHRQRARARQFPLRLAYATTFDGCQGLALVKTALDLRIDKARSQTAN